MGAIYGLNSCKGGDSACAGNQGEVIGCLLVTRVRAYWLAEKTADPSLALARVGGGMLALETVETFHRIRARAH
jgi:hypothetical protein